MEFIIVILSASEESLASTDYEIFPGVYPEPKTEILRFAQDDKPAKGQDGRRQGSEKNKRLFANLLQFTLFDCRVTRFFQEPQPQDPQHGSNDGAARKGDN